MYKINKNHFFNIWKIFHYKNNRDNLSEYFKHVKHTIFETLL